MEWMPFELRPEPEPTLRPEDDYLQNGWRNRVLPLAARMGVHMVLPSVSPQPHTHLAFEGYQFAKEHGKANEYNHRIFVAFFQEEMDIGNVDILTRLAGEVGLDEQEYRRALETRKYQDVHRQALMQAFDEYQITAVPTFIIGRTRLAGLYDEKTLARVIDDEAREQALQIPNGLACDINGNC